MGIKIEAAAYSAIGNRPNNEDNFYLNGIYMSKEQMNAGGKVSAVNSDTLQVYAVFDGMGGGEFGENASLCAATRLKEYQDTCEHPDNSDNLRSFLNDTSREIDKIALANQLRSGACGSTTAMLIIGDWWYRTAHVGDSRVYLLRDNELYRITKDQSEVQRMVDMGKITLDEAWDHPRKNVITHHLGMALKSGTLQSVISDRVPLQAGDCFLICSDGVSDGMRDAQIKPLLNVSGSASDRAASIVQKSIRSTNSRRIASDNCTAIVVRVLEVAGTNDAKKRVDRLRLLHRLTAALAGAFFAGFAVSVVKLIQLLM